MFDKSKVNCVLFLCEESKEKPVKNFINVFNEIMPEKKMAVTFDVVTIINTKEEYLELKLGLFLIHLKGKGSIEVTPIGVQQFSKKDNSDCFEGNERLFSETMMGKLTVKDQVFTDGGIYQIAAFWLDDAEKPEEIMNDDTFPFEKLASSTTFKVSYLDN